MTETRRPAPWPTPAREPLFGDGVPARVAAQGPGPEELRQEAGSPRIRTWLLSPQALLEMSILVGLAVVYNIVRAGGGVTSRDVAMRHAHDIIRIEGWIYEHVELGLNHWILGVTVLAVPACYFYALMHYVMTPVVLLLSRKRGGWKYWRGYVALVLACAIALVSYAQFPVAPPRLVPGDGAIDIMRHFADWGWWGAAASAPRGLGDATNQYAAMPSLHFGWSLWCGIQMWGFGSRWWKVAGISYPALQAVVVIATANHFGLDVVAGGACVIAAFVLTSAGRRVLARFVPGRGTDLDVSEPTLETGAARL